jgi:hypothetical protein
MLRVERSPSVAESFSGPRNPRCLPCPSEGTGLLDREPTGMNDSDSPSNDFIEVDPERMKQIIRGLRSRHLDRQNYWMRELLAIGPAAIPYLQAALRKEYHRQSLLIYVGLFLALVSFILHVSDIADGYTRYTNWLMSGSLVVLFGSKMHETTRRPKVKGTRLTEMLVGASQGMQDPRTMCLLLDLYYFEAKSPLLDALTDLLPMLKASDAALLSKAHREAMNRVLADSTNFPVKHAILKALEQVGDEAAVPIVERLAIKEGGDKWDISLSEAARETLPLLKMRIEAANTSKSLLRPAEQKGGAALMRPTIAVSIADETLLQPVDVDS